MGSTKQINVSQFRESYVKTVGGGAIETNTRYTANGHLKHLSETLGPGFPMNSLTPTDLFRL
jgi:hypothetical protein